MSLLTNLQSILKLRLFIFYLFISNVFIGPVVIAQKIDTDKKIQLSEESLTVNQLLSELHNKYAINFSYNDKKLPLKEIVSFDKTTLSLKEILETLSNATRIEFHIYNGLIILKQKQSRSVYTINGYVEDSQSGEKLIGANVYNETDNKGTTSNLYGYFSLTLAEGDIKLVVSYIGYKRFEQDIILKSDTTIHIKLSPSLEIGEVKIEGSRKEFNTLSKLSVIRITSKEVTKIPALLGEADVLKSLQLLPGVQSGSEGSSSLVVRGGGTDQNLILLDGVPVYNVNHLFGFFSVFNPNAIEDVRLYKSGFPARYGGRASSVIDIDMKEGNNKKLSGEGSIGLISSKFTLEGPVKNENTSFIISGRRTYLDIIAKPLLTIKQDGQTNKFGYYFYDVNMKINHRFSDKSRLFLSSYLGNDVFHYNAVMKQGNDDSKTTFLLKWGNITTNLRWNYVLNSKLFSNTTVSYTNYRFILSEKDISKDYAETKEVITENSNKLLNGIYDWSGKVDFDYFPNPKHNIKFGTGYVYHTFIPYSVTQKIDGKDSTDRYIDLGHEAYLYLEDNITIGKKASVNAGLRYSFFRNTKKNYFNPEPRLSVKYAPWSTLAFKASFAKMVQYIQTNSYSTISLPVDLWLPASYWLKPVKAYNYSLGADYQLANKFSIGVEAFYKTMKNVIAFKEGAVPNDFYLSDIVQGKGWSYGVEFMIRKNIGKTTGWFGYTWSHSWRQFDEISFDQKFPYKYDRRNAISLVVMHKFNDRIDLSGTWVFGTGNAMSLSTEKYISNFSLEANSQKAIGIQPYIQQYDYRNNYRMPDYHRLDLGVNFHKKKKRYTRTWSFGAYNVYNRHNPLWIYWDDSEKHPGQQGLFQMSLFQIIPYFTYSIKF